MTKVRLLLQIYTVSHDQQYIEKARHYAENQEIENGTYVMTFLEIYDVTKDPSDIVSARDILENDPSSWNKVYGFVRIWRMTHQSQDLEAARKLAGNVQEFLIVYRVTKDPQDLAAARKFIGGISDSFSFDKVGGFLEIYRFSRIPRILPQQKSLSAK
jgi:hypothetical protein